MNILPDSKSTEVSSRAILRAELPDALDQQFHQITYWLNFCAFFFVFAAQ
jgi:hypothetical protein